MTDISQRPFLYGFMAVDTQEAAKPAVETLQVSSHEAGTMEKMESYM
jgi:hypothetical protein